MRRMLTMMAAAGVVFAAFGGDDDEGMPEEGVTKVVLKLAAVDTPSTRSTKWNPPNIPMHLNELPHSEAEIQAADPVQALAMISENRKVRVQNQQIKGAIALQQYKDAMEHYKGMKAKLEGTVFGRQVLLAVDKFAGAAGENFDPDCIEFFHNMDAVAESDEAALISGKKSGDDLMTAPYFIKLIFDDPRIETQKGMVSGTEMKRTTAKIGLTYEVQALSGKMVTSGNIKKEKSIRESGAVQRSGDEQSLIVDTLEEAIVEAAKRINAHFVAKITVKVVPAKKDKEFDADSATLEIDGVSQEIGNEISIMKGRHTITVDLDDYKQKGSIRFDIRKSGPVKITLRKEEPKKDKDADGE